MKKILGLLAICSLVACNDSSETVAAPAFGGNQQAQDTRTQEQIADSIAKHMADSIAALNGQGQLNMSSNALVMSSADAGLLQSSSSVVIVGQSSSSAVVQSSSSVVAQSSSSTVVRSSSAVTPKSSATVAADDGVFKLELWDAADGEAQVPTGNSTGGWWYGYADDLGSEITWAAEPEDGDMTPVIAACGGICGDFVIGEGDPDENIYPYLGFAFGYAKNENLTGDATSVKGICVTYTYSGTASFVIELGMTKSQEDKLGSALPVAPLPKGTKKTVDYKWSEFEQPDWAKKVMTGPDAAADLKSIKFKFADVSGGESGSFAVYKVGPYGACN